MNEDPTNLNAIPPENAGKEGAQEVASQARAETFVERGALRRVVTGIARHLESKQAIGDVASLRRLNADDLASAPFWRIVATRLEPAGVLRDGPLRDEFERRWAMLLACMALCKGLHRPGERLGRALARAEIAEIRLSRLLRASGAPLSDALRLLAHQLASSATSVDWSEIAELVLSDGSPWAEGVRRRIARDFYGEMYRAERPETGDDT